jgi:hypothetical protein
LSIIPDSTIRKKPASFLESTFNAAATSSVKSGCWGNFPTVPPLRILRSSAPSILPSVNRPSSFVVFGSSASDIISGPVVATA